MNMKKINIIVISICFLLINKISFGFVNIVQFDLQLTPAAPGACGNPYSVSITWSTQTELSNAYFYVQRSADGTNFYDIGNKINGCGTTNCFSLRQYASIDNNPLFGTSFYRIRAFEIGGANSFNVAKSVNATTPISSDWKYQVTGYVEIASTPNTSANYSWHEESNNLQGVHINVIPTEKTAIFIQQNNAIINFTTRNSATNAPTFMTNIDRTK
jgi:hypothetical protein